MRAGSSGCSTEHVLDVGSPFAVVPAQQDVGSLPAHTRSWTSLTGTGCTPGIPMLLEAGAFGTLTLPTQPRVMEQLDISGQLGAVVPFFLPSALKEHFCFVKTPL